MVQCMLTYSSYKTPAEFDAGYANNIDAAVVAHWEAIFRESSAALAAPRLRWGRSSRGFRARSRPSWIARSPS